MELPGGAAEGRGKRAPLRRHCGTNKYHREDRPFVNMIYDVEFNSAGQVPSAGILQAARVADEKGFGTVWKGESNSRDPVAILPAIAAVTKRVRVGTAVIHIYARTPVETGIYAETMDELSNGRFVLGLGVANETLASWHGL